MIDKNVRELEITMKDTLTSDAEITSDNLLHVVGGLLFLEEAFGF